MATPGRISMHGLSSYQKEDHYGIEPIKPTIGPMGRTVDDVLLGFKALTSEKLYEFEKRIPQIKFSSKYQETLDSKHLIIGVWEGLEDISDMCDSQRRAIEECVAALENKGHTVIRFKVDWIEEAKKAFIQFLLNIAVDSCRNAVIKNGDKVDKATLIFHNIFNAPRAVKSILSELMKRGGQLRESKIVGASNRLTFDEFRKINQTRHRHYRDFVQKWSANNLDAMICPVVCVPAFKTENIDKIRGFLPFSFLQNYLGFCQGSIPVTTVEEGEEVFEDRFHKDQISELYAETMKGSKGMPIGVQIMAKPWEDEKCLAVMQILEDELKFHEKTSYPFFK